MTSLEDLAFGDAPSAAEAGFIEASVCFAQTSASDVVVKDFESDLPLYLTRRRHLFPRFLNLAIVVCSLV